MIRCACFISYVDCRLFSCWFFSNCESSPRAAPPRASAKIHTLAVKGLLESNTWGSPVVSHQQRSATGWGRHWTRNGGAAPTFREQILVHHSYNGLGRHGEMMRNTCCERMKSESHWSPSFIDHVTLHDRSWVSYPLWGAKCFRTIALGNSSTMLSL